MGLAGRRPAPLADDQPATARVVSMLYPIALADADADRMHVQPWGLEEAWGHLSPLLPQLPQCPPMNVGRYGVWVEELLDLLVDLIPMVAPRSGRVRAVLCRPCATSGEDNPHPPHVKRFQWPPEQSAPPARGLERVGLLSPLHGSGLSPLFGAHGRPGPRAIGPDVAAADARILDAPVPERVTSVCIRGSPTAMAQSTDDNI